jgi:hypothetical protein
MTVTTVLDIWEYTNFQTEYEETMGVINNPNESS